MYSLTFSHSLSRPLPFRFWPCLAFTDCFLSLLRFCDAVVTACESKGGLYTDSVTHSNANIYHSSNQTRGGNGDHAGSSSGRNDSDNSPMKRNDGGVSTSSSTYSTSGGTDLLPSLLTMYLHTFLQGAVRSSLQCPGEQSSLAAFRATKVLLSELQKSSRNGTLLLFTTRFLCDNDSVDVGVRENIVASSSSSSLLTPKKSENILINGTDKSKVKQIMKYTIIKTGI